MAPHLVQMEPHAVRLKKEDGPVVLCQRPCVVTTSSTAVLMVRHVTLLLGLVTKLQDLSPGSRSCLSNRSAVRMWLLHEMFPVMAPHLVQMEPHAVRLKKEDGPVVLCQRPCVVTTSSTAVLMVRHVTLLLGLVTILQDLSPGSRSCLSNRSAVRMWLLHEMFPVMAPHLVQMEPHAVRLKKEDGPVVLCQRPCVVTTSSTAVLMVRHVTLLLGLVTILQDLSPGSRSCLSNRSAVRMWLLHEMFPVMAPHLVQMEPHAVRLKKEDGPVVLCQRPCVVTTSSTAVLMVRHVTLLLGLVTNLQDLSPGSKLPVKPISSQNVAVTRDVSCDGTTSCADGTTCCKTKEGGWACCPLPEAVCCDDFIHCCPHGTTCNVAAGSCDEPSRSQPWFEKLPVKPISSQNVAVTRDVSCDGTTSCADGTTCCKTKEGGWACCPLPEAVCCDDFVHCCPHGTTCNVAAGSCDETSGSKPWFKKLPALPRAGQRSPGNVNCDSSHVCPDSNTCCKNTDGDWGCCPLPEAVCCKDKFHCCPHGTTCDFVTLTCTSNTTSVPMSDINPPSAKEEQRQHGEVKDRVGKYNSRVPCDSQTSCPDYTTCCLIAKTNKWGCCPLPNAVCCTDGEHCCPANYKCDVTKVSCIKGDVVIPWYNKISTQSTPAPSLDLGTVEYDERLSCSADSTCCHLSTGEWGCCPLPEAVCCPDQEHCCPKGYRCDLRRRSCIKTTWLHVEIVPLAHIDDQKPQSSVSEKDIQCGAGYSCKDSETCCPTSQTTWGCCPSPKAECCDDMKHCCPAGYKCGAGGTCTSAVGFDWNNWDNWRVFFSKNKRAITL
ncbi:granulin a isoform X1 [Onychostoma macrolepis]|uniref:granulin a isoform X1 n=1 Tax=Onychostoma macrolepis TaxID=369639 RepID=UPI00272D37EB|nr:granulin a isoform X1 [Onychostoma macrolepis]